MCRTGRQLLAQCCFSQPLVASPRDQSVLKRFLAAGWQRTRAGWDHTHMNSRQTANSSWGKDGWVRISNNFRMAPFSALGVCVCVKTLLSSPIPLIHSFTTWAKGKTNNTTFEQPWLINSWFRFIYLFIVCLILSDCVCACPSRPTNKLESGQASAETNSNNQLITTGKGPVSPSYVTPN